MIEGMKEIFGVYVHVSTLDYKIILSMPDSLIFERKGSAPINDSIDKM